MSHLPITYGFAETPFGAVIVARTALGVCDLQFLGYHRTEVIHELGTRWGVYTSTTQDDRMAQRVLSVYLEGARLPLMLHLQGTDFQKEVWRALRLVPFGQTVSYQGLAERVGHPTAVRAVASAVAANPIALLVPCHRVIHADGRMGQYHWGADIKQQLLRWEEQQAPMRQDD